MELEGDCLQVVTSLRNDKFDELQYYGVFVEGSLHLIPYFTVFTSSFICRWGNYLAHGLAHLDLGASFVKQDNVILE